MLQFRLKTILTIIAIIAMCVIITTMSLQRQQDRSTLDLLRVEAGTLDVDDPSLIHVRNVETHNPYFWKWRIYAPPNTQMEWGVELDGKFNFDRKPSSNFRLPIESNPDGVPLTISISPLVGGLTTVTVRLGESTIGNWHNNLNPDDWLPTPDNRETAGKSATETFTYGDPIHLIRRKNLGTSSDDWHPLGGKPVGLDVWAVPEKFP